MTAADLFKIPDDLLRFENYDDLFEIVKQCGNPHMVCKIKIALVKNILAKYPAIPEKVKITTYLSQLKGLEKCQKCAG